MEKKYYDAPQMEIVKLQHSMNLLDNSLPVDTQTIENPNQFLAPDLLGDDSGEDW